MRQIVRLTGICEGYQADTSSATFALHEPLVGNPRVLVTIEVRVVVTPDEQDRLIATRRPVSPEAHDFFLRGRYHYSIYTREEIEKAIGYFRQGIARDPEFAPAYALLGEALSDQALDDLHPRDAKVAEARAHILKAVALDPTIAEAHAALGWLKFSQWDWRGAEAEFNAYADIEGSRNVS